MSDVLQKICARTKENLETRKAQMPLSDIKAHSENLPTARGFIKALEQTAEQNRPALIAEVKKASPSKGLIRADFDPVAIASAYERAGASCLSVLTDEPFFQGKDEYLIQVRKAVKLPVLRKDFMIDPYQIYESKMIGADCILLIVAALDDAMLKDLFDLTSELGMDALIEVHNEEELERAAILAPKLIGVNNRNLKTLEVTLDISRTLAPQITWPSIKVAESGIYSTTEIIELQNIGYSAFLVGESLMRQDDVEKATKELLAQ